MFVAVLFIMAKTCTTRYYSGFKINEFSSHEKTGRKLICILLRERSQCEKATNYTIPTQSGKRKRRECKDQWVPGLSVKGRVNRLSTGNFSVCHYGRCMSLYIYQSPQHQE
jgi:hypothetical protein